MINKVRPLGELSDFAVEVLPIQLEKPSKSLLDEIGILALRLELPKADSLDEESRLVAALDVKMLELGLVHSNYGVPDKLSRLVEHYSLGIPMLTYEEIILANPLEDLRTFTCGKIGDTERLFYTSHREIEMHLSTVIQEVQTALPAIRCQNNISVAMESLGSIEQDLYQVLALTAKLRSMPAGEFDQFRKYLGTHPTRDLKGPSGAFSPGMYLLEILTRGRSLTPKYLNYVLENGVYFPREGFRQIQAALELVRDHGCLEHLAQNLDSPELTERYYALARFFNDFRAVHYRTVDKQLPQVTQDKVVGTGGEEKPGTFLRERRDTLRIPINGRK